MIKLAVIKAIMALVATVLRTYPRDFRETFGQEMQATCAEHLQDVASRGSVLAVLRTGLRELFDVMRSTPRPADSSASDWGAAGREVLTTAVYSVALVVIINFFVPRYIVEGASMQPSFYEGNRLVTSRIPYMLDEPQRGDVIVLDIPNEEDSLLKRVIGLPGETVVVQDEAVFVDGVLLKETYINAPPGYQGMWTLGPIEYFVLGDNRNRSNDSADFGPIDREQIISKVLVIYWPPPNWSFLP